MNKTKITFTTREILSIIKLTADLYNNRTVSRERYEHVCEILNRCDFMSFKRLCELTVIAVETIEGQPVYEYLLDRFNRNDKMSYIVRHLYD